MAKLKMDDIGNYYCYACKTYKPLEDFYNCPKGYRSNRSTCCKECSVEQGWRTRTKNMLKKIGPAEYQKEIYTEIRRLEFKKKILEAYLKGEKI